MNDELTHDEQEALDAAIGYVNANLADIGNSARLHIREAQDVVTAFVRLRSAPNVVLADDLISAVEAWQAFKAEQAAV